MSEPLVDGAVGWYGKLPGLGDFASRRLPSDFVQAWDEWLQQGLAAARAAWGPAWLDRYLVAPILRFWLAEGTLGESAWAGLVMPSVDRVGRHFPLTLAHPGGTLAQARAARAWFGALDAAARQVLDTEVTVDDFERVLATLPPLPAPAGDAPQAAGSAWWRDDEADAVLFEGLPPPQAFARMFGGEA